MISFKTIWWSFTKGAKVAKKFGVRYAPQILTGLGIASMAGATAHAIKTAPKAKKAIDEIEADNSISHKEAAKKKTLAYAKFYWPELLMTFGGAGLIIGGQHISLGRLSTAVGLLGIEKDKVKKLTDKISEKYGDKELLKIQDDIARDSAQAHAPVDTSTIYNTGFGTMLCYDPNTQRFFWSDLEKIRKARDELNHEMSRQMQRMDEGVLSLNDWYRKLNLPPIDGRFQGKRLGPNIGKDFGWRNRMIELQITAGVLPNDQTYFVIGFTPQGSPEMDADIEDDYGTSYGDDETDMPWR